MGLYRFWWGEILTVSIHSLAGSLGARALLALFAAVTGSSPAKAAIATAHSAGWQSSSLLWFAGGALLTFALCLARTGVQSLIHARRTPDDVSSAIPDGVQTTLDLLSEGVLIVDPDDRIVLANTTFCNQIGEPIEALIGRQASELGWCDPETAGIAESHPWLTAMGDRRRHKAVPMILGNPALSSRHFMVSGAAIVDHDGSCRGAIATFDDVTELEQKTDELGKALVVLEKSQEEIRVQNEELHLLATRDSLTGCLNRRSFVQHSELVFAEAVEKKEELTCVMVDIDHFKQINDHHGHATGDEVINVVAFILASAVLGSGSICRYGGEEFCILLPGMDCESAREVAEQAREAIEDQARVSLHFTASFGISALDCGSTSLTQLIDQADRALYGSKNSGRNRTVLWEQVA
jgi:diguanylate cyclase (GGDEF)-like protein